MGDPREREAELVLEDVLEGLISVEGAQRDYGVVIDPGNLEVDTAATADLRRKMKSQPGWGSYLGGELCIIDPFDRFF